jgi:hypothetical protein
MLDFASMVIFSLGLGWLALLRRPYERFSSIAATEWFSLAVVDMPGGGTFRIRPSADCVNQFHEVPSSHVMTALDS